MSKLISSFSARRFGFLAFVGVSLTGCAEFQLPSWAADTLETSLNIPVGANVTPEPVASASVSTGPLATNAVTAEELDQTTATERAAATQTGGATTGLGSTIATLGDPSEPGFWLKTPLVSQETQGVVRSAETGKSATVTLIPIEGPPTAGSRISLSAMRLLELPLTSLAELSVSQSG